MLITLSQMTNFADDHFNPFPNKPWFLRVCSTSLIKTLGKGEIVCNEQFLFFSECFLPLFEKFLPISSNLESLSANFFILEESKICHLRKGLIEENDGKFF